MHSSRNGYMRDQAGESWSAGWPAPAKLNLFLHITGRRADGYHLLQTLFQFLDYGDELAFRLRRDNDVYCTGGPDGLLAEQDLTVRAARLLMKTSGMQNGVDIRLEKRIPVGSGLGGGSSDAATTLVALNALFGLDYPAEQLAGLGASLGADVPVFIHGQAAWAEGIGDELTPVELSTPWYLVIQPPCQIATADLYRAPELTRNCKPITIHDFSSGKATNVFLPVVRTAYPVIGEVIDWLGQYGVPHLTGSGACVFSAFETSGAAREVLANIPADWHGFVARGLNRSPLDRRAAEKLISD